MQHFKVGQKVRVKTIEALKKFPYYPAVGQDTFVGEMEHLAGTVVTIRRVTPNDKYLIKEFSLNWTHEMLEPIVEGYVEDIYNANF